jgi:hypothetical protein
MAGATNDPHVMQKLKLLEEHARKLVEAGAKNDWHGAEIELMNIRLSVLAISHVVEEASDLQRMLTR